MILKSTFWRDKRSAMGSYIVSCSSYWGLDRKCHGNNFEIIILKSPRYLRSNFLIALFLVVSRVQFLFLQLFFTFRTLMQKYIKHFVRASLLQVVSYYARHRALRWERIIFRRINIKRSAESPSFMFVLLIHGLCPETFGTQRVFTRCTYANASPTYDTSVRGVINTRCGRMVLWALPLYGRI